MDKPKTLVSVELLEMLELNREQYLPVMSDVQEHWNKVVGESYDWLVDIAENLKKIVNYHEFRLRAQLVASRFETSTSS